MSGDAELMAALAHGDLGAFRIIFDREAPVALALAVRIAGDRIQGEEIVRDTFLALWVGATNLDEGTNVRAWICDRVRRIGLDRRNISALDTAPARDDSPVPSIDALPAAARAASTETPRLRMPDLEAGRRLLLIEPDTEVATAFRDILVDLGFQVSVHSTVLPWWPDVVPWDVVVLNAAGASSGELMGSVQRLRDAPETADALIVCGGWPANEVTDAPWLAANRVSAMPGALDIARLTDALRIS